MSKDPKWLEVVEGYQGPSHNKTILSTLLRASTQ